MHGLTLTSFPYAKKFVIFVDAHPTECMFFLNIESIIFTETIRMEI